MKESNSPRELHKGMTYPECLERLEAEALAYDGSPVPGCSGEKVEHPLHLAVRLVESWQEPHHRYSTWRRMPGIAWNLWGDLLRASRCGNTEIHKGPGRDGTRRIKVHDYGEAQPEVAKQKAAELAAWARREIVDAKD